MKQQFVDGLREGQAVDSYFAVRDRQLKVARGGRAYLALELTDRTGTIRALQFRPSEGSVERGGVVHVRGTVTSYRGERRISIEELRPSGSWSRHDLLPAARRDRSESLGYLEYLKAEVRGTGMRAVLDRVFGDEDFLERFCEAPASRNRHHAYLGGLLEHTASVACLAQQVAVQYEFVDADLLLAAALLHDVGKVEELASDAAISYTDEGRLVGHVVLGERRVSRAAEATGLPRARALRLSHVMLSHHGELEWGSPRRPATLEAVILHHVDNLDAKVAGFMSAIGRSSAEERWTDATNLFRRPLYVPRAAEDDRRLRREEDDEYCMESAVPMD